MPHRRRKKRMRPASLTKSDDKAEEKGGADVKIGALTQRYARLSGIPKEAEKKSSQNEKNDKKEVKTDEPNWQWDATQEAEFQIQSWDDVVASATAGVAGKMPPELLALSLLYLKPTVKQLNDQEQKDLMELGERFPGVKWAIPYRRGPPGEQYDVNALAHFKLLSKSYATWHTPRESSQIVNCSGKWRLMDLLDCSDSSGNWCIARIVAAIGTEQIRVHYEGWGAQWDEWIKSDSDRLQPFKTHIHKWTGKPSTNPSPDIRRLLLSTDNDAGGGGGAAEFKGDCEEVRFHSEHQLQVIDMMARFSHVLITVTPPKFREPREFTVAELESAFGLRFWHDGVSGRSEIYCCNMFALRPADFQQALQGLYKRYLVELPNLAAWEKRKVDTCKNRTIVGRLLALDGPIRDELELTADPQQVGSKDWANDLYARWVAEASEHKGLDTFTKAYGLFLVDTDPKLVGFNVGTPYFDGISHILIFPTTSLAQLALLIHSQHEFMQKTAQKNRIMYQILRDLTERLSKKLGDGQNIVSYRQLVWYEQNPFVDQIIEVYRALVDHADRIKHCLKFVSPTIEPPLFATAPASAFIPALESASVSTSAFVPASASSSSLSKNDDLERSARVNAYLFVVPPSSQKIHLEASSCVLRIPATFNTSNFDLEKFVAAVGGLIPSILIPHPLITSSFPSSSTPSSVSTVPTSGLAAD